MISDEDAAKLVATPEDVRTLLTLCQDQANSAVADGIKAYLPTVLVTCRQWHSGGKLGEKEVHLHLLATDFNADMGKKVTMKTLAAKLFVEAQIPMAACLISEAWIARCKPEERNTFLRPSDYHDRREVLLIAANSTRQDCGLMAVREIARTQGTDKIFWQGEWSQQRDGDRVDTELVNKFFRAYTAFALKQEDPKSYLPLLDFHEIPK